MNRSKRICNLKSAMTEFGLDGILISRLENRVFLSGFDGSAGYLLISKSRNLVIIDFRYREQARQQSGEWYEIIEVSGKLSEWLPALMEQHGIDRMGLEGDTIPFIDYQEIITASKNTRKPVELVSATELLDRIRLIKDCDEIASIQRAVQATEQAMSFAIETAVLPGLTEKQIAWEIEKYVRENGGNTAFPIIVASGGNSAMPHAQPSQKVIEYGEPILIDLGVRLDGYCGDMTRTLCLGGQTDIFKNVYHTVYKAKQAAIRAVKSGMAAAEIDLTARKFIEDAGYGEYFKHSVGHGIGLAVHERPWLSGRSEDMIKDGMVFTIEPGIYIPDWGGVRLEDDYVLECGKIKALSGLEKRKGSN
ncbi:peptidase M24 [Dehalogenimonas lykanthroporepellens BL-DC-9]|nr:peptidase M24 [Dehalogenimonas lykanthroporepellens BL-DC-9]